LVEEVLVKYTLLFIICSTAIVFLAGGCTRQGSSDNIGASSVRKPEITEEQLKKVATNGTPRELVISVFGKPSSRQMKDDGTIVDYYLFHSGDGDSSWKHHFSALQIVYAENRVTKWLPIYSSRSVSTQTTALQPTASSTHVDSVTFLILANSAPSVTEQPKNDLSIENALTVRSLKSVQKGDQLQSLTFELLGEDARRLRELTETNIGHEMVIQVGKEPVARLVIMTPVGNGQVDIVNISQEKVQLLKESLVSLIAP